MHYRSDDKDRSVLSDGWYEYFGFRIPPEDIRCDGCLESGKLIDENCPVRPCVLKRGLETCGDCEEYPCEKVSSRFVDREEIERGEKIPEEDYQRFIRPYENKRRLRKT